MDLKLDTDKISEMAAQKVADEVIESREDVFARANAIVEEKIESVINDDFRAKVRARIEERLEECLEATLNKEFVPVDMWGEATGKPTTIRAQIHQKAKEFFEEKVEPDRNNPGGFRVTKYGGTPRWRVAYEGIVKEQFEASLKTHVGEVVKGFRDAMKKDLAKTIAEHVDSIINNRRLPK